MLNYKYWFFEEEGGTYKGLNFFSKKENGYTHIRLIACYVRQHVGG